jgi:hypothetical protein
MEIGRWTDRLRPIFLFVHDAPRPRARESKQAGVRSGQADYHTRKFSGSRRRERYAVGCRSRGRALRPKNNAWLATAETTASWNGLAIRNAGSGRCPVRKRSG